MCCQQMWRTENVKTYAMYSHLKKIMEYENQAAAEWKTLLYHGCSCANAESIVAEGLNRSHCQSRGTPLLLIELFKTLL